MLFLFYGVESEILKISDRERLIAANVALIISIASYFVARKFDDKKTSVFIKKEGMLYFIISCISIILFLTLVYIYLNN